MGLFLSVLLIVSLTFPLDVFDVAHSHWARVAWIPFVTGIVPPLDLILNVALYLPLGYFAPGRTGRKAAGWGLSLGLMLSMGMELAQVWSHRRVPSMTDVAMNVTGAGLGVWLAWGRHRRVAPDVAHR